MAMANAKLPPQRIALVDPKTGIMDHAWYFFFQQLQLNGVGLAEGGVLTDAVSTTYPNSLVLTPVAGELEGSSAPSVYSLGLADSGVLAGVYGSASFTISGTVDAKGRWTSIAAHALNTSNITEGANLFYTDARARAALSGTAPISYNSTTGAISHATSPAAGTYATFGSITIDATGHVTAFTP